jgi:NAD(P)-dependent dehydrogenase (short-subunit alcohol dehydrogenase family)
MKGKTVVITGGTSGIGEAAAGKLAEMGARIVLVARDKSRGEETLARLRKRAPDVAHTVHCADLTRILDMKRVAAEIAGAEPRIDVLISNAGAMFSTRKLTEDGLETTFARESSAPHRPRIRVPRWIWSIFNWRRVLAPCKPMAVPSFATSSSRANSPAVYAARA